MYLCIKLLYCKKKIPLFKMIWLNTEGKVLVIQFKKKKPIPQLTQWKRICLQCRRLRFNPWVRKIPWRRKQQPTPVFLPGEFYGQQSLGGSSP